MSMYPRPVITVSQPARIGQATFRANRSGVCVSDGWCQVNGIVAQFFAAPMEGDEIEWRKMGWTETTLYSFRDWLFYKSEEVDNGATVQ